MADEPDQILLRNILVALDSSSHSRAALEAAAALARTMEAHIQGLFVEDANWHHLSRLSLITEVSDLTGNIEPLARKKLKRQIRMLGNRIHRQLQLVSRRKDIKHSWRTVQGSVEEKVLEAAKEADLITIGRKGQSFGKHKKMGRTAKNIIEKSNKPVLILQEGLKLGDTIVAVYDGSQQSRAGLRLMKSLARKNKGELFVLALVNDPASVEEINKELGTFLENVPFKVSIKFIRNPNLWSFLHAFSHHPTGLLMIPKDQPFVQGSTLELLLDNIRCPLLLMEQP